MWGSKEGKKKQAKQDRLPAAAPAAATAAARVSRLCSMRHLHRTERRLRDSRHAGLCGVAMAFDHVMIVQLV
jgi:hypothetical protein